MPREVLGDLLRALGQNPTQAEVAELISSAPREGAFVSGVSRADLTNYALDTLCERLSTMWPLVDVQSTTSHSSRS